MGRLSGTDGKHLKLSEEGEGADLWQMWQSEKYTDSPYHSPMCPRLGCVFTGVQGIWELVHGDWRTGPEWELLLAVGDRLRRWKGGNLQQGMPMEEDLTGKEAERYCWVTHRGRSHYCSLSLPTHWRLPTTIIEAHSGLAIAHQQPSNKKKSPQGWPSHACCWVPEKARLGLVFTRFMLGTRKGPH